MLLSITVTVIPIVAGALEENKIVKLATVVERDPKASFSIATTPMCWGGRYSFPRIAPL